MKSSRATTPLTRFSLSSLSRQERTSLLLLGALILLGAWMRFAGIGWSLPDARHPLSTYHPDELINLSAARAADLLRGQFDIGFYNYGAFYFYLVSFAQILGRGWGLIPTTLQGINPLSSQAAPEMAALFLTGRVVTALLGIATIPLLYFAGSRFYGKRTGLIAAGLYAIAPLAVVHAHFLTVDVPATFFVTLTLFFSAKILFPRNLALSTSTEEDQKQPASPSSFLSPYLLAGIAAGLAAATKYTAVTVLLVPLSAYLWRNKQIEEKKGAKPFFLILGGCVVAFLLGCPGVFLNPDAFWNGLPNFPGSGLRYELLEHSRTGHGDLFTNTGNGWWYHLWISLRFGLGLPLLIAALFGVGAALKRRNRADRVLLVYLLVTYALTGLSAVRFARYMIPLFPVLFLFVGRLLSGLKAKTETSSDENIRRILIVGLGVATLSDTMIFVDAMQNRDPRDLAANYIEKNLKGKSIAFAKTPWFYSPPLSPLLGAASALQRAKMAQSTEYQFRLPATEWSLDVLNPLPDAVIISNFETMHEVGRLRLPEPTRFMDTLEKSGSYKIVAFGTEEYRITMNYGSALFGSAKLIPEDLLYVVPKIYVYLRKEN